MNKHLLLASTLLLAACATTQDPFSREMSLRYQLPTYSAASLQDTTTKVNASFIYTLLANTQEIHTHQFNGATDNEVFVSDKNTGKGYPEIVVRFSRDEHGNKIDGTGVRVTDCENMGSFNYKHPVLEPMGHFAQDTYPWLRLGNCETDSTTAEQRLSAYMADIRQSLETLVDSDSAYVLPIGFNFGKSGQSETFGLFMKALGESDFDLYDFAMTKQHDAQQREKFYAALESGLGKLLIDK